MEDMMNFFKADNTIAKGESMKQATYAMRKVAPKHLRFFGTRTHLYSGVSVKRPVCSCTEAASRKL